MDGAYFLPGPGIWKGVKGDGGKVGAGSVAGEYVGACWSVGEGSLYLSKKSRF